jgi:hypothetical protein
MTQPEVILFLHVTELPVLLEPYPRILPRDNLKEWRD